MSPKRRRKLIPPEIGTLLSQIRYVVLKQLYELLV